MEKYDISQGDRSESRNLVSEPLMHPWDRISAEAMRSPTWIAQWRIPSAHRIIRDPIIFRAGFLHPGSVSCRGIFSSQNSIVDLLVHLSSMMRSQWTILNDIYHENKRCYSLQISAENVPWRSRYAIRMYLKNRQQNFVEKNCLHKI
jgi:hypothetical protein